ncbi:transposase [Olsenella sp. Marseille-P4559]|uniref:transposase n=1 Tax=Olsenella sp. Marseille-P4559 TaxID=2364795 RepID=UPI001030BDFA|nr:transposase [Olsenella sp. Marseille-P4559]
MFRAWDLREDPRAVFRAGSAEEAEPLLAAWLHRAACCRIGPVVEVEKKVRRRHADVIAAVGLGIGNGRVESINNEIKVTVRMGYGFRNTDNLVALLMLRCSDEQPALPWEDRGEEERRGTRGRGGTGSATGRGGGRRPTRRRRPSRPPSHENYRRLIKQQQWQTRMSIRQLISLPLSCDDRSGTGQHPL